MRATNPLPLLSPMSSKSPVRITLQTSPKAVEFAPVDNKLLVVKTDNHIADGSSSK